MNIGLPAPLASVLVLVALSACSPAPTAQGISDPHEAQNRRVHNENLALDRAIVGPVSRAYGEGLPPGVRNRVSDFSANVSLPGLVVNNLLQGNVEDAVHHSWRFVFNATLGLGGLFDPASDIGLEERSTDFGETLHVWGFAEGDYVVLPVFGPSTERDAAGTVVDFFINPLTYVLPGGYAYVPTGAKIVSRFGDRYTYASTFEELFYESADAYATARLYYLENRRYELSGGESSDELYDIYEEAYD